MSFIQSAWGRVLFDLILLASLVLFPWYVPLALGILGAILYPLFLELFFAGVMLDALYGIWGNPWVLLRHTIIFGGAFLALFIMRKRLSFFRV